jgi:serine/threonine-protein kinase
VDSDEARAAAVGGTYFLGRYRVVDEIGVGGMASVHLARMDGPGGFQKWVAIKRIHPHLVEDETFVNMFLDEARVAARISHPNVATVFELGKHEDTYWIAMEYLHGEPLREVMRRTEEMGQPMPPEIACRAIADAAEGLHSAHELLGRNGEKLQLVHRDVTPHNLFVTYDGTTKVVDFGIAKFSSRMANTRAGTLKGKLAYMSPEQVAGEPIDRRTDVFALGVVLWELTTGQRLFRMDNDLDTLAKVQECNVPRPSTIVRGYPIDLEKIVMKALAKNKNERYRTAREFSRALQSLLMRRGLFIASDEVSSYMASIFADRILKREAHLRWAAEVTQTIDIDKLKGMQTSPFQKEEGSILTYSSEVQASQAQGGAGRSPPRPAAGAPHPTYSPHSPGSAGAPTPLAIPAAAQAIDLGATLRPEVATVRPPAQASRAPAPAPRPARLSAPVDTHTEDPPTLARPRGSAYEPAPDEFDDNVDTIVSDSFPELDEVRGVKAPAGPPSAQTTGAAPIGVTLTHAASPAAMAIHTAPRPAPPRHPTMPPMPAVMVPAQPPPLAATVRLPSSPLNALPPGGGFAAPAQPQVPASWGQPPAQPSMSNEYPAPGGNGAPAQAPSGPVDMQRLFAPPLPNDQRTITAQALKKRIPVWAVAVGSAVVGLLAFGLVVLVLTHASSTPSPSASSASDNSTAVASAAAPVPPLAVALQKGPFGSARAQFAAMLAAVPAPTHDAVAPAPPPPPATATAAATTPGADAPSPVPTTPTTPTMNVAALPTAAATTAPAPAVAARAPAPRQAPAPPPAPTPATTGNGTLKVICFPGCDQVIDNGSALGPSPIVRRNANLGSHRIKLVWSDTSIVVSTIVMADQTATVRQNHP